MKKISKTIVLVGAILMVLGTFQSVAAGPPEHIKSEMFICPSVSINNPNSMWVIGAHGAYNIILPASKSPNWNTDEHLNPFKAIENNPADVEGQAQVKAGKGLYRKLGDYFDSSVSGKIMVLPDDGTGFLEDLLGMNPGDLDDLGGMMITVVPSDGTASYADGTLYANVPLASAVFW
ncbi:MAG: hypothetical protein K8R08_03080 [Methanosarcinales archaeon]|nr:hypothetical protein [Methanosarcinales archaeon]